MRFLLWALSEFRVGRDSDLTRNASGFAVLGFEFKAVGFRSLGSAVEFRHLFAGSQNFLGTEGLRFEVNLHWHLSHLYLLCQCS